MSNLSVFHFESSEVRFVNGKPVANDVAKILGYSNPSDTIRNKVNDDYKENETIFSTTSLDSQVIVLKEAGIYQLIFSSKLDSAKRFQKWVFEEVLPQIRKTGQYSVNDAKENLEKQFLPDRTLKELKEYLELSQSVYGEAYKQRLFPIVIKKYYPDLPVIEPSTEEKASLPIEALLTPTQLAQELGIFYSTGNPNPRKVNDLLAQLGYQEKIGGQWSATDKAKELCDRKPVDTNSRSQKDQLMWSRKILDILKEHSLR